MLDISSVNNIVNDRSYRVKPFPSTIPRKVLSKKINWISDLVLVVQGVRRSGKSILLTQIANQMKLKRDACFFINFEDPRLSENLNFELLNQIIKLAPKNSKEAYFFFDEIQNVKQWEKWLNQQIERPGKNHFIITGSNASLLAGDLSSVLTGRHQTIELYPFDFEEYKLLKPKNNFLQYMDDGGFPEANQVEDGYVLLREYFHDIVERDVRRHVSARSTTVLAQLAKIIYEATASETSFRNLSKILDVAVDTVKLYIEAFASAYLCLPCTYFTYSERQRLVRPCKYYPIDTGLYRAIVTKRGEDLGKRLETIVFLELKKRYKEVYYWKQKGEVDFVVSSNDGITPYQVSWEEEKGRHVKALEEFKNEFKDSNSGVFINRHNIEQFLAHKKI